MPRNELEQALRRIYNEAYIPAISYALLLTQHPDAAVATVEEVFARYARRRTAPTDPLWLFDKISLTAPNKVVQRGMLPGNTASVSFTKRGMTYGSGPVYNYIDSKVQSTAQPMITDPVRVALERRVFVGIDSQYYLPLLLNWLDRSFSEMKLLAILEFWLLKPENRKRGAIDHSITAQAANMAGLDVEDAEEFLKRNHQLWQEITAEEKNPPTLEQVLSAWPIALRLPSMQTQIAETVARESSLWRHPFMRYLRSAISLGLIIAIFAGIFRPELSLLPWQWRSLAQIPLRDTTVMMDLEVEALTLQHPWKGVYLCRDSQGRKILITEEGHIPNAQFIPAHEEDHIYVHVDIEGEKAVIMRLSTTERLYIQYFDLDSLYLYRIEGDLSEQELIRLCRDLEAFLRTHKQLKT